MVRLPALASRAEDTRHPEPREPHDPHGFLFLREHEIIHSHLPTLHYLARMRVVEYQDWDASSSSLDGDNFPGAEDSDDSGDNNYNGYHPEFEERSKSSFGPTTFRMGGGNGAPSLGRGSGPAFRPRGATLHCGTNRCRRAVRPMAPINGEVGGAHACSVGLGMTASWWSLDPYQMVREGQFSLGGRAWSSSGSHRFGRGPQRREITNVASPLQQDRGSEAPLPTSTPVSNAGGKG